MEEVLRVATKVTQQHYSIKGLVNVAVDAFIFVHESKSPNIGSKYTSNTVSR